jgi:lipopolysaccharide export system permease protein
MAQSAGLPTIPYDMRFHDLCSTPLKLVAMVLIAAVFAMRPVRSGGVARLLLSAIAAGFALYVLSAISAAMGESGTVPVAVAAWAPAIVALLAAGSFLLKAEEA